MFHLTTCMLFTRRISSGKHFTLHDTLTPYFLLGFISRIYLSDERSSSLAYIKPKYKQSLDLITFPFD